MINVDIEGVLTGLVSPLEVRSSAGRLYVLDQVGIIYVITRNGAEVFLDLESEMDQLDLDPEYDERGLMGFILDPDFDHNGIFYTFQSSPNNSTDLYVYRAESPVSAHPEQRYKLLSVPLESQMHNGGKMVFDENGYLYLALGDDGTGAKGGHGMMGSSKTSGDLGLAQDYSSLRGKIIRIIPRGFAPNYSIPRSNPDYPGGRPEIYAAGFRNPWGMSIDEYTQDIFVANAGEADREGLFILRPGMNAGWSYVENGIPYKKDLMDAHGVEVSDFDSPIYTFGHDLGSVIIGGGVYRGRNIPSLWGKYLYSNFSPSMSETGGRILALEDDGMSWTPVSVNGPVLDGFITGLSFCESDEVYITGKQEIGVTGNTGFVLRLTR